MIILTQKKMISLSLVPLKAEAQTWAPENLQVAPAKEAGRLNCHHYLSLHSSKSNLQVSFSGLQQTTCCRITFLSLPFSSGSHRSSSPKFLCPIHCSITNPYPQTPKHITSNPLATSAMKQVAYCRTPPLPPFLQA